MLKVEKHKSVGLRSQNAHDYMQRVNLKRISYTVEMKATKCIVSSADDNVPGWFFKTNQAIKKIR